MQTQEEKEASSVVGVDRLREFIPVAVTQPDMNLRRKPRGNLYPQVQEQLVKDHTRTESVMRDQGMKAIEAADQLSSDFVKLQDSRDRKR